MSGEPDDRLGHTLWPIRLLEDHDASSVGGFSGESKV